MYNPFSLEGKSILVTGASSGIGQATAIECSRMGAKLIVTGRNEERLKQTLLQLDGDGHLSILADLADNNDLDSIVEKCPQIDGLVNNAGVILTTMTQFMSRDQLECVIQVNAIAPIMLFQKLLKKKKIRKGSSVVFLSSISGPINATLGNVCYSTSKAAICGFVKNSALDLASKKIRVNAVCPGMIDTHILDNGKIDQDDLEREREFYPMKRFGKPEEVAWAIIYLLSNASSFTTGTLMVIDGGITLK